jgi:acyl carrier protein
MRSLENQSRIVTLAKLAEISQAEANTITGGQRLREDLGMDSLQSLELLSSIGEALKIDLDIEKAMAIRTVDDACEFVEHEYREQEPDGRIMCG